MKKQFRILFSLLLLLPLAVACGDPDPTPTPTPTPTPPQPSASITFSIPSGGLVTQTTDGNASAEFPAAGGTATAPFSTTVSWTASSSVSWCTVSPASGASGSVQLSLTIAKNENYDDRSATVTISAGSARRTISVKQSAAGGLLVSPATIEVPADGGDYEIEVSHNVDYTVEVGEDAKAWIGVKGTKSLTSEKVGISVSPNEGIASREGTLKFKGGTVEATVKVSQKGVPVALSVSADTLYFGHAGGTQSLTFDSNAPWTLSVDADWIEVSPVDGEGDGSVTVKVKDNPDVGERRGVIVAVTSDASVKVGIAVVQYGKTGSSGEEIIPGEDIL